MANIGKLQTNVKNLKLVEDKLREAFITAEKEYSIPVFNLKKSHAMAKIFLRNKSLKLINYYPLLAFLTLITAIASLVYLPLFFAYAIMVYISVRSFELYRNAITRHKLRDCNFVLDGFGIKNLSLTIFGILNLMKSDGNKITKDEIGSILKIVKSKYENEDVSLGFAEHLKKLIYATLFTLPYAILSNWSIIQIRLDKLITVMSNNIFLAFYLSLVIIFIFWVVYDLIFTQTRNKRQQKKYLLMLNIIHESWSNSTR